MVRKKMKKAPSSSSDADSIALNDITGIVCSWLKDLDLVGHDLIPAVPTELDIFSLVQSTGESSAFAQARGLQALRAGVVSKTIASAEDLRLIFLVSLLLFIHPETSHLRKAVKSLLAATENAVKEQKCGGSDTDGMVELVAARFAARSWDMYRAPAAPPADEAAGTLRMAASLQWLADLPAGKRALLAAENGALFLRFVAVLDAVLGGHVLAIDDWRTRRLGAGQHELGQQQAAELADVGSAIDNCSEVLKAAASLMSLTTEWDANRLAGSESTLQRMCKSCLLVLSVPTVHREAATHASAVLVRLALASWRASGGWPSSSFFSSMETVPPAAAAGGEVGGSESHSSVPEQERGVPLRLAGAAAMIAKSFFPGRQGRGAGTDDAADSTATLVAGFMPLPPSSSLAVCRALLHIVRPRVLLAGLGAEEGPAEVCPPAMVAEGRRGGDIDGVEGATAEGGATRRRRSLMLGHIFGVISRHGGASSGLSLRFLALQILEAWCNKAKAFAESGLCLDMGSSDSSMKSQLDPQDRGEDGARLLKQSLSQVMDLTMSALVHPAKLISSMAPGLLEHVFTLRRLIPQGEGNEGGQSEPERLVGRVLEQPATSKGKYVALAVLLPRVGALRALELCPSLVEQLVWAVGVRGNVSGQAVSLLLQFLKAMSAERYAVVRSPPAAAAGVGEVAADGVEGEVSSERKKEAALSPPGSGGSGLALCRLSWVGPAAAALMQEDLWSRSHVAAYLLPEVFKLDPGSVGDLFLALRSCGREGEESADSTETPLSPGNPNVEAVEPEVRRMWAMIEVARFARKCGAACDTSVIADSVGETQGCAAAGLLQLEEVQWAALHVDETLRMSALSLLCTDARVTTVPAPTETQLLREVLPYSLKVFGAQSRQLLLRAMQTLFTRFRETVRVCAKGVSAAPAKAAAAGDRKRQKKHGRRPQGASEVESGNPEGGAAEGAKRAAEEATVVPAEAPPQTIERVEAFMRWLCQEVLRSLYPGCPFEREVVGLELVQLVLSELLPVGEQDASMQSKATLSKVVSSSLFCRHWVDTLLALLGSSWDRSRALAYSILARFPRPLAGYEGLDGATRLAAQGLRLSSSGRQRESDRGALVLRLVFGSYARGLWLRVPLLTTEVGGMGSAREGAYGLSSGGAGGGDASAGFLEELCGVLTHRLDGMQHSFDALLGHETGEEPIETTGNVSLPHGVLLAAHHVLVDSKLPEGAGRPSAAKGRSRRGAKPRGKAGEAPTGGAATVVQWERRRKVAGLLLEQAFRALRLSLMIVGEHGGDDDSGSGDDDDIDDEYDNMAVITHPSTGNKAKDKSRSSISVNANGHMGMVSLDNRRPAVSSLPAVAGSEVSIETSDTQVKECDNTPNASGHLEAGDGGSGQRHTDAVQRSAMEGQRAVVGAWLLAKEACQFLATIVSASPLPSGEGGKVPAADQVGAQDHSEPLNPSETRAPLAAPRGVEAVVVGSGSLLTQENVTAVGETLLKTLLSLKHMGCVASAQAALQAVCEALLHSGRRNIFLLGLPSIWMDQLLRQLTGEKQEFVLRRSAGLALAFMAILRAEPRSVDPVLLPRCMRHLLAMAMTKADEADSSADQSNEVDNNTDQRTPTAEQATVSAMSSGDWKSTVHALNVLRVIFVDATLANDVGPYVTEAMTAAVCGFEHSVWAVRNSSMMLFASIMQRAVGGAKNVGPSNLHSHSDASRRPHAARGAVTAEAFFQQHSKLHPFLLSQLERAADHTAEARAEPGVSRAEMHPVLYPILLLLARLKAGGGSNGMEAEQAEESRVGQTAATATAAFVPLVIRCASNPHFLARVASARALAALVPPTEAPDVIIELLGRLPEDEADPAIAMSAGASAHNHIHGTLLQVLELLLAVRASTSGGGGQLSETPNDAIGKSKSPAQVGSAVLRLLWLADPTKSRCPPIRYAMLQLIQVLDGLQMDGVRDSTMSTVHSALRSAEELNFSHEATSHVGSADGRCRALPGRSVLASTVAAAVVRRRLESSTIGGETSRRDYSASGTSVNAGSSAESRSSACIEENMIAKVEEPNEAERLQLVADMLSSSDVDVRDAAIKATKKAFGAAGTLRKAGGLSSRASLLVWAGAATALMAETHPPNIRRLVRLLSRVGFHLQGCCLPSPMAHKLWDHLRGLCQIGSEDVHAGALEVMGVVMRLDEAPAAEDESGPSCSALRLDEYTSLLEDGVDSAQPVVTRAAVAASLASSGLLKTASTAAASAGTSASADPSTVPAAAALTTGVAFDREQDEVRVDRDAGTCTRLWFVALSLLQDDDEGVRDCTSRACAAAASHGMSTTVGAGGSAGGRVDLCAVDRVLSHLAAIAENDGGGRAAEHFVSNLLRVLVGTPGTTSAPADAGLNGVGIGANSQEARFDMEYERNGEDEDEDTIFGHERRNQFQEPAVFARVAAPYLCRALVALDAREGGSTVFPAVVLLGLARVLGSLSDKLEELDGAGSASWHAGVYGGLVSAAAVGAAVFVFFSIGDHRTKHGGEGGAGGLLSRELARARKACEDFEAVRGGSQDVHPEVSSVISQALYAASSF